MSDWYQVGVDDDFREGKGKAVDAGPEQTVLLVDEGNGARQILGDSKLPIRTVIVGIVDVVTLTS